MILGFLKICYGNHFYVTFFRPSDGKIQINLDLQKIGLKITNLSKFTEIKSKTH